MNKNYWQFDARSFMLQLTYGCVRLMPSYEMARGGGESFWWFRRSNVELIANFFEKKKFVIKN